eukprot:gene8710-2908_t
MATVQLAFIKLTGQPLCFASSITQLDDHTDLHTAARNNNLDAVKKHHKDGEDLEDEDSKGQRPIHIAARNGFLDLTKYLIANHVDVNCQDRSNSYPLDLARDQGHNDVAKVLVEAGARDHNTKKSAELNAADARMLLRQQLLIDAAAKNRPKKVVKLLTEEKLDPNVGDYD